MIKLSLNITEDELKELIDPWVKSINNFAKMIDNNKCEILFKSTNKNGITSFQKIQSKKGIYIINRGVYRILKSYKRVCNIILADSAILPDKTKDLRTLHKFTRNNRDVKIDDKELKLGEVNKEILQKIFNYEWFKNGNYCNKWERANKTSKHLLNAKKLFSKDDNTSFQYWSAEKLCEIIQSKTCAYCNLQFLEHCNIEIKYIGKKDKKTLNWIFDHYYSQSEYPYLSISVFNLIPVCEVCNTRIKHDKEYLSDEFLHPYQDDFHKIAKFKFLCINYSNLPNLQSDDIIIDLEKNKIDEKGDIINESDFTRASNTCDFFGLKDRIIQEHSDYIGEIIFKCLHYPKDYQQYLRLKYNIAQIDIKRLIFGNYIKPEDINRRPLSKITIDIVEDFKKYIL